MSVDAACMELHASQSVRLRCALMIGFLLILSADSAFSQTRPLFRFAIAAEPLAAALNAYSAASGLELFYDGELVIGRQSSAVVGLHVPEDALRQLLVGTGLVARPTGPSSFTIMRASPSRAANTAYRIYFSAIQARVSQMLCARAETRPGDRDVLLRLWIASSGIIQRTQLLDPPDHRGQEEALAGALGGVWIGSAPPAGMPQPITLAILARADGEPSGCVSSAAMVSR